MAISGVNPKCYILALFVRDDGARFLLGDDPFEFKDNQLHFQQNTMANDVVEVQGNDGYLLAGQVRRPGTQMFDGYVCNGTNSKEEVEVKRRAFLQFFRRSHFYKVIYVFPNGTAIQRKQGFLVDDPTVQELYQQYPEYHVALNFEDVNYYTYEEDDQGHEIYAKEAIVALAGGGATGGLIWDEYGVVWEDPWSLPLSISGVQFQILNNAGVRAPIDNVKLYGDTYQQTYSGKNLFSLFHILSEKIASGSTITMNNGASYTVTESSISTTATGNDCYLLVDGSTTLEASDFNIPVTGGTDYTLSYDCDGYGQYIIRVYSSGGAQLQQLSNNYLGETGHKTATFTTDASASYLRIRLDNESNRHSESVCTISNVQLEKSSSETAYEPFVGGIPAPNPDYPQPIQVVTGEQTVKVAGKNLWGGFINDYSLTNHDVAFVNYKDGSISANGTANSSAYSMYAAAATSEGRAQQFPAGTYTLSGGTNAVRVMFIIVGPGTAYITDATTGKVTFTLSETVSGYIRAYVPSGTSANGTIHPQLELNSTATAYEPYQSQSYTIDLGSTELCKIGDYQDYIYKSGDDWYVHKACDSSLLGGFTWTAQNTYNSTTIKKMSTDGLSGVYLPPDNSSSTILAYCTHYQAVTETNVNLRNMGVSGRTNGNDIFIYDPDYNTSSSPSDFKTWLSNNSVTLYYVLATPTDTKITDATLVGQLNTLGTMKLFIGENNVLVSTTEPNLPATLAFDYYTKFAAIGAEWEEGGTKGATIVNVDAIDNTYPVWELTGPATNPTLSVLTTNTTLTYNGTITASQKLVIDMFNKTATLNGTSVIGNISGDFVYMAPGTNRVAYTAGNTDAPDSTIYWQEVVG